MSDRFARIGLNAVTGGPDSFRGDGNIFPVIAAIGFGALGGFALLFSGTAEPVILLLMALLATVGVFFLLALATGHVRIADRGKQSDIARTIAEDCDEALHVTDRRGRQVYANRTHVGLIGSTGAGEHRALEDALAGEPAAVEAYFRLSRAAERGETRDETFPLSRAIDRDPADPGAGDASGGRWYRLGVRPLHSGQLAAVLGRERLTLWTLLDVTSQRALQTENLKALQTSLVHYEQMPAGLLVVDGGGRIEYLNGALAGWLGISPELRSRGLKITDVVSGDGAALLRNVARDIVSTPRPLELDLLDANGCNWPARLMIAPRRVGGECLPNGQSTGFVAAIFDRVGEVAAVPDGTTSASRLVRLFQSAPFGIAMIGPEGRITGANSAFARLLLASGTIEGMVATELLAQDTPAASQMAFEQAMQAALSGKANIAPIEIAVGEAGEFTRRVVISALGRSANAHEAAILYIMDATEQKALEISFAQSQKMEAVGKLAGGIAHDFNNVLTAIIGFSDLLLQTHRPTDAAYKNIMAIKSSANRAAGMVSQLLAFSRRQTLQPEVLQLGETLGDLAVLLNRLLGEKIDLKITQGRDLWYVKADRSQLGQVIINLAVNARDAMLDGGRLKISTRNVTERESQRIDQPGFTVAEYVLIEVEDTGHGMSPEVMAKIFEPFFTTKGVGKGTGLGLSTVYGIVKQTGGFVFLESTPGQGTTFRLYLPRHHVESAAELINHKAVKKERAVDLTGSGRVLLVEDEDAVRGFAVEALRRQGYEVLQASSGVEALEVIAATKGPIDLVVSDVIMPEMDGPTLLKELRRSKPKLKFVFMSGYPDDAFKNTLDPGTEFAFLQKPFSLVQLATKVKEQIGR